MSNPVMIRDETLVGACQAVGEGLGFNPLYLRVLFALAILSSPVLALAAYAALTALATVLRWLALDSSYQGIESPR